MAENTGLTASDVAAGDDINDDDHNELVADVKKIRQETLTAGETINGATLPVAIYQSTSDNEVYNCDANDTDKLNFLGFAITNSTDGNNIVIQHTGVVGGFSGLDEGEEYYVQDDGTIGTSPGTYLILVGIAISTTQIYIKKISDQVFLLTASDNLKVSADVEHGPDIVTSYTKIKEVAIYRKGTIRIKFSIKQSGGGTADGRIYIDGVAVGISRSTTSATYIEYSEDITVEAGDLVQLYYRNTTGFAWADNFRIYYELLPYPENTINLD